MTTPNHLFPYMIAPGSSGTGVPVPRKEDGVGGGGAASREDDDKGGVTPLPSERSSDG